MAAGPSNGEGLTVARTDAVGVPAGLTALLPLRLVQ